MDHSFEISNFLIFHYSNQRILFESMLPSVQNFSMIIMDILIHISNFLEKKMETHHRLTFKKMLHSIFINKDFSQRGVSDTIS